MAIDLKVPEVGESITEVEIGEWLKRPGDSVQKDETVVTLESEKATVDLPAPVAGVISEVLKKKGDVAKVGEVIARVDQDGKGKVEEKPATPKTTPAPAVASPRVMPAAQRVLTENGMHAEDVKATGPGGRLLKEDVQRHVETRAEPPAQLTAEPSPTPRAPVGEAGRDEEVVPMTKLRRTLAERLVEVQNTAAMLTTFNEVDMSAVAAMRKEFSEAFVAKHQTKLGFMSFFVKATIEALKAFPAVNAEIRGSNIVYHNYYDIGVAVGGGRGLVVPVLRNAERMSFAEVELAIADFGKRAKENKLKPDELQGGTFTITNGGVYGSLLSTPILNPPQSGILGMHGIQERPIALNGQVVIRSMMYIALTYDHRVVDGREAVTFLRRLKEIIENPARMLLEV